MGRFAGSEIRNSIRLKNYAYVKQFRSSNSPDGQLFQPWMADTATQLRNSRNMKIFRLLRSHDRMIKTVSGKMSYLCYCWEKAT